MRRRAPSRGVHCAWAGTLGLIMSGEKFQQAVDNRLELAINFQDKTLLRVVSPSLRISAKAPLHVILSLSLV